MADGSASGVSHKASHGLPVRLFRQPHRSCHPVTELIGSLLYRECGIVSITNYKVVDDTAVVADGICQSAMGAAAEEA